MPSVGVLEEVRTGSMFREMRRKKQQLTREECIEILKAQPRGVMAVYGEDGYPYAFPLNYIYDEASGKLYFHGAKSGHKVDAVRRNDKVSFCVYDSGYRREGEWALNIRSVILFGRIRELTDPDQVIERVRALGLKYADSDYVEDEIRKAGSRVLMTEMTVDHMTGKLVNES